MTKLDIFDVMAAIDTKNYTFFEELPKEHQDDFSPFVALRWTSTVERSEYAPDLLVLSNLVANVRLADIRDHPELQFKLLVASGAGQRMRHGWIKPAGSGKKISKFRRFLEERYPEANGMELDLIETSFSEETLREFLRRDGCDPDMEEELINAFTGKSKAKAKAKAKRSK